MTDESLKVLHNAATAAILRSIEERAKDASKANPHELQALAQAISALRPPMLLETTSLAEGLRTEGGHSGSYSSGYGGGSAEVATHPSACGAVLSIDPEHTCTGTAGHAGDHRDAEFVWNAAAAVGSGARVWKVRR